MNMVDDYSQLQARLNEADPESDSFNYLSPERKQKFDLLWHLLVNLSQPLVLTGPDGIGKSTFLDRLQQSAPDDFCLCRLECTEALNLEQIQNALHRHLGVEKASVAESEQALQRSLLHLQRDGRILVLALDNAGCLMPGVFDAVCRSVASHPPMRLVAALRPDELHLKASTDPWAVEQAHVIDLPPLMEAHCGEFVRVLWKTGHRSAGSPTDEICQRIYRASHGVPAEIIQLAGQYKGNPPPRWHRAMAKPVYIGLAVLVAAVAGMTWWYPSTIPEVSTPRVSTGEAPEKSLSVAERGSTPLPVETEKVVLAEQPAYPVAAETAQEAVPAEMSKKSPGREELRLGQTPAQSNQDSPSAAVEEKQASPALPRPSTAMKMPQAPHEAPVQLPDLPPLPERAAESVQTKLASMGIKDRAWLLAQNPSHYTLQIAAFDNPEDLIKFAKRYARLGSLAVYRKKRMGKDWYSLVYGVYSDNVEAKQAIKRLPPALGSPWLRRIRAIQKEIRAATTP